MKNIVSYIPVTGMPDVVKGDDIAQLIIDNLAAQGVTVQDGDIIAMCHKIVSKAEGRVVQLGEVTPSAASAAVAAEVHKDPAFVDVIMSEAKKVYVSERDILITFTHDGWISCNSAVDHSNVGRDDAVVLLPLNSDASAKAISDAVYEKTGVHAAVIICDTHGRALRDGITGVTVGCYGIAPIVNYVNKCDRYGRVMHSSYEAVADEIAGGATLLMGQGSEGIPAVLVRGYSYTFAESDSTPLKRREKDMLFLPAGKEIIM